MIFLLLLRDMQLNGFFFSFSAPARKSSFERVSPSGSSGSSGKSGKFKAIIDDLPFLPPSTFPINDGKLPLDPNGRNKWKTTFSRFAGKKASCTKSLPMIFMPIYQRVGTFFLRRFSLNKRGFGKWEGGWQEKSFLIPRLPRHKLGKEGKS